VPPLSRRLPSIFRPTRSTPRSLRIYRVPRPPLEEREILPPKPILHTRVTLHCIDLPTTLVSDTTWASSGLFPHNKSTPTHHNHIAERGKLTFALIAHNAHGLSLIMGSAKLFTLVGRSSYLVRAIDKVMTTPTRR
jgi:hypothetical protein